MDIREILRQNRSYRRYRESCRIDRRMLLEWIELTRLCPSAANRQPLRYIVAHTPEQTARVFPHLRWAAALKDWPGPAEGERPAAYLIILGDTRIANSFDLDAGIAAQSILMAAVESGFGGCMVGSIDRKNLRKELAVADDYEIVLVVALGKPNEQIVLEEAKNPDDAVYWRDDAGVHHVPKRPLDDLLVPFDGK